MTGQLPTADATIKSLDAQIFADLDLVDGGCRWWHGYQDWKRLALINDYLIQVSGTLSHTTVLMAHHINRYDERWTANAYNFRRQHSAGSPLQERTSTEELRDLDIEVAVRGFFDAAAHTLDLVATLFVGVLGLKDNLRKVSWQTVCRAQKEAGQPGSKLLDGHGSPARALQELTIRDCANSTPHDPDGWIKWTRDTRNTFLHRAQRIRLWAFTTLEGPETAKEDLSHLLPAHPSITDDEVLAQSKSIDNAFLMNHVSDLMRVVYGNITDLVSTHCRVLEDVWIKRRNEPSLIVQPGQQWPKIEVLELPPFVGAAQKLKSLSGSVTFNPRDVDRWWALKVMDDEAGNSWGTHR